VPVEIIDLFAGPGGLDVAATWLGLHVTGIEIDDDACATRKRAGLPTVQGDVRDFGPEQFPDANVLAAGPPCQTYTVAGSGTGRRLLDEVLRFAKRMANGEDVRAELSRLSDVRTALVLEPLRWILEAWNKDRPYEAVVLEQVPAVLPVWQAMDEILTSLGYKVSCGVLRTEQYGVPQTRRRAILIAHREYRVCLPKPTHRPYRKGAKQVAEDQSLKPWTTIGHVVRRSEPFHVVSNYGTGGNPKDRGIRRHDEPSFTVTGKIDRNRVWTLDGGKELARFTDAEAGQLQTFPSDYPWAGGQIAQQIGNAIPPLLAAHVLSAALNLDPKAPEQWVVPNLPKWFSTTEPGNDGVC
jgi:DNA (cytosine-5)-methyltransferase 1